LLLLPIACITLSKCLVKEKYDFFLISLFEGGRISSKGFIISGSSIIFIVLGLVIDGSHGFFVMRVVCMQTRMLSDDEP